ncbi:MAG: serine protease [bacterium]
MKKIVLGSLLVCTLFFLSPKVGAENISTMDAVFKIQAYSYNKLSDMYVLQQYGSAVLIADNILLTNAHVVTDTNGTLNLQYEACQTISNEEAPKCFSTLQLLKYDKNSDLALLQIVNPSQNMPTPVTIGSGTLAVGDAIRIVGYPANGGQTITTTQGTIA